MPLALLHRGLRPSLNHRRWLPATPAELQRGYDVVIIGGGGHGLAIAYYLASQHGIKNTAVLEKGYLGGGNTARNTAIVRSNYLTPPSIRFYSRSVELFRELSNKLGLNIMYSERGHLTLAHSDAAVRTARWRAEANKELGIDSEFVDCDGLSYLCPELNFSQEVRHPILGALYHPPGAIARHDAMAWGYAAAAGSKGVDIHQGTEVTGITISNNKAISIKTNRGTVACGTVVQAVAGSSSLVAAMADLRLPIRTIPLQACVSQPVKRFLDPIIVSGSLHVYISQSARGEFVIGGAVDPYGLYSQRSTLDFLEHTISNVLELLPALAQARVMRQWAGITDMTPDFSPVMGKTPIENYYLDAGWGTWGFKATPVVGETMAELVATGRTPGLIKAFDLGRFHRFEQLGERAAASVGLGGV